MKKNTNLGFSLVELLIAVAILGIIMVAIASFASSTTATYMRTRDDVRLQQDSQETFDYIADKIIQAKKLRIVTAEPGNPTNTYEFGALGDKDSVEQTDTFELSNGSEIVKGQGGTTLYSFSMIDNTNVAKNVPKADGSGDEERYFPRWATIFNQDLPEYSAVKGEQQLRYVVVLYDTNSGADAYGSVVDVFCFDDKNIYLYRLDGSVRLSSTGAGSSIDETDSYLDSLIDTALSNAKLKLSTNSFTDENLLSKTLTKSYMYVRPSNNSLFLHLEFARGSAESVSEGTVKVRNSYVLQKYMEPSASTDTSSDGSSSSDEASSE